MGATTKALFFCIEAFPARSRDSRMHHRCYRISISCLFSSSRIEHCWRTLEGGRPVYNAEGGHGLFLFFRSRSTLYMYCGASLHVTTWGASRRSLLNSNTRRRIFLCRELMSARLRENPSEILLEMDSYQLQTFARSLGALSAISIPAGTGRRGQAFQEYIYLS